MSKINTTLYKDINCSKRNNLCIAHVLTAMRMHVQCARYRILPYAWAAPAPHSVKDPIFPLKVTYIVRNEGWFKRTVHIFVVF